MTDCCEQMELPLLSPLSFDEILASKGIRDIVVAPRPRLKNSWRMKIHSFSCRRTLYVPSYLENAPENIKEAVIAWAMLFPKKHHRKRPDFSKQKKILERMVLDYMTASGHAHKRIRKVSPNTFQSKGRFFDLQEVFDSLNESYFNGKLASFIRWNNNRGRSYQTTFTDTHGGRQNLISIAQLYNRLDTPRYAVEAIVFHEMLHIAVPPYKRNFRNVIHGKEFKLAERSFPYFKQWQQWERERMKKGDA
jgi:hypothetical protein